VKGFPCVFILPAWICVLRDVDSIIVDQWIPCLSWGMLPGTGKVHGQEIVGQWEGFLGTKVILTPHMFQQTWSAWAFTLIFSVLFSAILWATCSVNAGLVRVSAPVIQHKTSRKRQSSFRMRDDKNHIIPSYSFVLTAPSTRTFGDATPPNPYWARLRMHLNLPQNRRPAYPFTKGWALRWTQPRTKRNFTHNVSIPKLLASDRNRERS
jgi:hypothetical protein